MLKIAGYGHEVIGISTHYVTVILIWQ